MHIIAAKAVAFGEALREDFKTYQQQVVTNAKALADGLQAEGFRLVSGGTDNHLVLVDVFMDGKGVTGKVAEKALEAAGITANKNTIPFDTNSPFVASGIRLGTPALTTRGMTAHEMSHVAKLIAEVLHAPEDEAVRERIKEQVETLAARFPLYAKRIKRELKAGATSAD